MHRKDRERTNPDFINGVLADAETIWLGMNRDGAPYVLPLNFAMCDGVMYIHCAHDGMKLDLIRKNPHVGFATATDIRIIREKSTTRYRSIAGSGHASILQDTEEMQKALAAIQKKYHAQCTIPASATRLQQLAIIRIDIDEITGKESQDRN